MIEIMRAACGQDYAQIATLAARIWPEHYTKIIGAEQVRYMLDRFQSAEAIEWQCTREGYRYAIALWEGVPAGYAAVRAERAALFLSKLYVEKEWRGHGIARALLDDAISEYSDKSHIYLTVNKHNEGAIAAYQRMGFAVVETLVADIGGGYVMDDYRMERPLRNGGISQLISQRREEPLDKIGECRV